MTILSARNLNLSYNGSPKPVLKNISLDVHHGEFILIAGESGSGKSSLLNCLSGLVPKVIPGRMEGSVHLMERDINEIPSWEIARYLALVFQEPEDQFFALAVDEELSFGPRNLGVHPEKIRTDLHHTAREMKIESLLPKSLHSLSEGQKKRVAIAANLMMNTTLFLFDEPLSNMDEESRQGFSALLEILRKNRKTIILSEHRIHSIRHLADRIIILDEGEVTYDGSPEDLKEKGDWQEEPITEAPGFQKGSQAILSVSDLNFRFHKRSDFLLRVKGFSVAAGEALGVTGPNGAGKTTLLRLLSGFLIPQQGAIFIDGQPPHLIPSAKRSRMVRMVFQNPDHQLFMPDCLSEILFPLRHKDGKEGGEWVERSSILLDRLGLTGMEKRHPHSMSLGEKKRLAIASALFHRSVLLLLDEPTTGIDRKNLRRLIRVLKEHRDQGTTLIIASHDQDFIQALCDKEISLI